MLEYLNWRFWLGLFIQRGFLISLERATETTIPKTEFAKIRQNIRNDMRVIYRENQHRIVSKPDRFHLAWAALVLAAYRILLPIVGNKEKTLDLIRDSFSEPFRKLSALSLFVRYGVSPLQPEKAFPKIARNFKPKGERFFGPSFVYEQEVLTEKHSFVNVRKCFFYNLFQANGVPEVTPVLCNVDTVYMDELSKPKYGMKFERLTALGHGDDACRFRLTNTMAK